MYQPPSFNDTKETNYKFINLSLDILNSDKNNFLIDTGSDICIIKRECIHNDVLCYLNETCYIKGISPERILTLALCRSLIKLPNNEEISQDFQIVPNDFPLPCAGIIGRNFLENNKCKIDYQDKTVKVLTKSNSHVPIPFCFIPTGVDFINSISISVPARVETVIKVPVSKNFDRDYFCSSKEIFPGVFMASAIINPKHSFIPLSILNTNDNLAQINNLSIQFQPLNDYDVYN